ncbi:MAG: hypothetical protein AB7S36_17860, partial [Planctomycetota bacterium]
MARAKGMGGQPRDLQTAHEQTHQITGFRLTPTSAAELIATAALATMTIVFGLLAFTGWRYGNLMREAGRAQAAHRLDTAPDAAARAAASYGSDLTAQLVHVCAALEAGKLTDATDAADRLQLIAPGDPDAALARAVLLLTDPATASLPASRTEAETLLQASGRPEALAALGQLALDRGDLATARRDFRLALEAGDGPIAGDAACAIAYNGLGLCRLLESRDALTPAVVADAIDDFRRALAYRRPWAPPMVNRDRAAAIWLRLALRDADLRLAEAGSTPAAHRAAVQSALDTFNTRFGFIDADRDVINIEPGNFAAEVAWPAQASQSVRLRDGVVNVQIGRVDAQPLIANRQRYLSNVLGMATVRLIDTASGSGELRGRYNSVRQRFESARTPDSRFRPALFNELVAALRMFSAAHTIADRQVAITGDLARRLRDMCDGKESEGLSEALRAPMRTAMYVVMCELPDRFVDGHVADGLAMLALLERTRVFERMEASTGPRRPAAAWLAFQRAHIEHVATSLRPDAMTDPAASLRRLVPWVERVAAWLPLADAPDGTAQLNDPAAIGEGPLAGRPASWSEAGLIVRLYEQAVRDLVIALLVQVQPLPPADGARIDMLQLARRAELARLRLCGSLVAADSWCFGRVAEANRVLDGALESLRRIQAEL